MVYHLRKKLQIHTFCQASCSLFTSCQVTQIVSQQQVQAELTLRLTQLQTRLASLKIENEEVRKSLDIGKKKCLHKYRRPRPQTAVNQS